MGLLDWLRGDPKAADGAPGDGDEAEAEAGAGDPPPNAAGDGVKAPDARPPKPTAEKAGAEKPHPEKPTAEKDGPARAARPAVAERLAGEPRLVRVAVSRDEQAALEHIARGIEAVLRIEQAVQPLVGMLQATAKSGAKSDQERRQQFLDLRAHITGENDRLAETLRARIAEEAAIEVFRAIVPALDEIDHVLRERAVAEGRGLDSVRLVRRKLRDALSRLGIEEIPIEEGVTQFDPELHEGKPHDGDGEEGAEGDGAIPAGAVTRVEKTGYMAGDKVVRCALVTVIKG